MSLLTSCFDRVYIISCRHRWARREALKRDLDRLGLADVSKVKIVVGIDGRAVGAPDFWTSGEGAWGCYQAHRRIIEDILNGSAGEGYLEKPIRNYLVLEDDAYFLDASKKLINNFLASVPADWDQIYLGGQHTVRPEFTHIEGVLRGRSINRTHAYAVNEKCFKEFYAHLNNFRYYTDNIAKHVDHHLETAHRSRLWNVYCPRKFPVGQRAGHSDIRRGEKSNRRFWNRQGKPVKHSPTPAEVKAYYHERVNAGSVFAALTRKWDIPEHLKSALNTI